MTTGWEGIDPKTKTDRWEQYWRAGYTVGNATPVEVNAYCRSERQARDAAAEAARPIAKNLGESGVDLPVVPWIEVWRVQTVTKTQTAPRQELNPVKPSVDHNHDGDFVVVRSDAGIVVEG